MATFSATDPSTYNTASAPSPFNSMGTTDSVQPGAIPSGAISNPSGNTASGTGYVQYSGVNNSKATYGVSPNVNNYTLTYGQISPGAYSAANTAQQGYLDQAQNNVNQYISPTSFNYQPYSDTIPALNTAANVAPAYSQAISQYAGPQSAISGLINQYSQDLYPNSAALNQTLVSGYKNALANYNNNDLGTAGGSSPGITNPSQLYGAAANNFSPYMQLGANSSNQLNTLSGASGSGAQQGAMNAVMNSPYVTGQLQLGSQAIAQQDNSLGMLQSGNTMRDLQSFGQNLAGNALQQYTQNLISQASLGQNAAQNVAGVANQQNAAEMNQANAQSALQTGSANAQVAQANTQVQANLAQQPNELAAQGLGLSAAQQVAGLYTGQQAALSANQAQDFSLNNQTNQQNYAINQNNAALTYQSQQASNAQYVNYLNNILAARGQSQAAADYGQGQSIQQYKYSA